MRDSVFSERLGRRGRAKKTNPTQFHVGLVICRLEHRCASRLPPRGGGSGWADPEVAGCRPDPSLRGGIFAHVCFYFPLFTMPLAFPCTPGLSPEGCLTSSYSFSPKRPKAQDSNYSGGGGISISIKSRHFPDFFLVWEIWFQRTRNSSNFPNWNYSVWGDCYPPGGGEWMGMRIGTPSCIPLGPRAFPRQCSADMTALLQIMHGEVRPPAHGGMVFGILLLFFQNLKNVKKIIWCLFHCLERGQNSWNNFLKNLDFFNMRILFSRLDSSVRQQGRRESVECSWLFMVVFFLHFFYLRRFLHNVRLFWSCPACIFTSGISFCLSPINGQHGKQLNFRLFGRKAPEQSTGYFQTMPHCSRNSHPFFSVEILIFLESGNLVNFESSFHFRSCSEQKKLNNTRLLYLSCCPDVVLDASAGAAAGEQQRPRWVPTQTQTPFRFWMQIIAL